MSISMNTIASNNTKEENDIYEIINLFNSLNQQANEFLSKLTKDKTELQITEKDGKITNIKVHQLTPNDPEFIYNLNCLDRYYFDDDLYDNIIYRCNKIKREIEQYKDILDNLLNNIVQIKKDLGLKLFRSDNLWFKTEMLDTQKRLDKLINFYTWEF